METCNALHARFPVTAIPSAPDPALGSYPWGLLATADAALFDGRDTGLHLRTADGSETCKADADDGEWSHLSGVLVSWIHGRPFRMESGEMYTGDWMYHPGTLANGGPDAVSCD